MEFEFPERQRDRRLLSLLRLGARVGDFLPASPITTEAMNMLAHGNISNSTFLHSQLGYLPRPLPQALAAAPSCRADRWLARMLPVRAALIVMLGAVWVGSGLASFALPSGSLHCWLP